MEWWGRFGFEAIHWYVSFDTVLAASCRLREPARPYRRDFSGWGGGVMEWWGRLARSGSSFRREEHSTREGRLPGPTSAYQDLLTGYRRWGWD